jgi:hypothetical protein
MDWLTAGVILFCFLFVVTVIGALGERLLDILDEFLNGNCQCHDETPRCGNS